MQGLTLSTVAASDDHRARPGQPHFGRTAVAATGLTREEIFDALYHRRTYGTTGVKILLDFAIDGKPIWRVRCRLEAGGTVREVLRAPGTPRQRAGAGRADRACCGPHSRDCKGS